MTHFTQTTPTARKAHRCGSCGRTIAPREKYRRGAGMDGSTAWTYKECAHCAVLARYVTAMTGDGEYSPDDFHELGRNGEPAPVLRVAVQYRRRWTDSRGRLYPLPVLTFRMHTTRSGASWHVVDSIQPGVHGPEGGR